MAETQGGIAYKNADADYFAKRGLRAYAGVWSLWALGVGAVISGHYSGWNLGLATGGWGGMFVATIIIAVMYLGLTFSIAEMSPALPHTGAAYSFARTAMGPWGGFVTGLCENVEYVLTPAVIVFFIGSYLGAIFGTPAAFQPVWWIGGYILFVGLNVVGVELSFRVTLVVTLMALAVLAVFWIFAIPLVDFSVNALDIAPGGGKLEGGNGPFLPFGLSGALATLPFAVRWIDSRDGVFAPVLPAQVAAEHSDPVQSAVAELAPGSRVLIMSFSHAEDLDIVVACLQRLRTRDDLPYVGLIGSRTKWATFRHRLEARGFTEAELARVTCPIGVPGIGGKEPEVIAVAVAAQLLQSLGR